MPYKPKRPCAMTGCGLLAENGKQYCLKHQQESDRRYDQYQRNDDHGHRYGRAWKRIRDRYVRAHPLCEECKKQGKLTPTEEVHHILPLSKGGTNAASNLMALCKSCHSKITAESGDRWGSRNL